MKIVELMLPVYALVTMPLLEEINYRFRFIRERTSFSIRYFAFSLLLSEILAYWIIQNNLTNEIWAYLGIALISMAVGNMLSIFVDNLMS